MENKTDPKKSTEIAQDVDVINMETSSNKPKSTVMWLAILGLLCLQAGFYWLWLQQTSVNETLNQQLMAVQQQASQQNTTSETLANENQTVLASLEQQQQEVATRVQTLAENQLFSIGDVKQYWALAEVEYLLNVANQRVVLASDIAGAQTALEMADNRIEALSDYRFHPLRALLAEEQLALSVVANLDVEGLVLQLQSGLDNVENLQILMGGAIEEQQADNVKTSSETLQSALDQAWKEIKSLVVVRHQEGGAAAVLVPEQQYFLYQNLRLKLESAQLALLSGQQAPYEENLKSAAQWLQQYFVGDDRDAILEIVTSLQTQQIAIKNPDISGSLEWLQQQGGQ